MRPGSRVLQRAPVALLLGAVFLTLAGGSGATGAGLRAAACRAAGGQAPVAKPRFVRNIATGETGWFSSPGLVDLNGDGRLEIVAPFYSTFVFDAKGRQLGKGTATKGRVYAPAVVADLDGDGKPEIVVGGNGARWRPTTSSAASCRLKSGWPASTCSGGQCPEVRGHGGRRPRRRRPRRGGGDDDEHLAHRRAGVRLRRRRQAVQPGRPRPAWPRYNR